LLRAFKEDVDALEAIEALLVQYPERQPEISFHADRASLAMRHYLQRRARTQSAHRFARRTVR